MLIKLLRVLAVVALAVWPLVFSTIAQAIDDPDSDPSVSNIKGNVYLIEEDDLLIYGEYDIPYGDLPNVAADDAFIFRLIDTDNVTQLGAVLPFALFDSGYNIGAFGFYFSAADNISPGEAYTIRISQNPAHFTTPTSVDYVIPLSAYTSETTQEANQTELAVNIISAAQRIEDDHAGFDLLESSAGGTVLSDPTGETYFRGVIYGIQSMAPELFLVQVLDITTTDRTWTTAQFDTYQARFAGTWVGEGTDNTSSQFGVTAPTLMGFLFAMPLCIGGVILSSIKYKKAEPGFIAAAVFLILASLMGWMPTAIFATVYQIMAVYLAYIFFYARG